MQRCINFYVRMYSQLPLSHAHNQSIHRDHQYPKCTCCINMEDWTKEIIYKTFSFKKKYKKENKL